ncbi:MAG: hypothetical protein KME20_18235 [Kaiparowitsia implicata GSE-PSE-MK54-09C]|jgi:hypothetical protein|nr:hypothetical protein [Kaiparowitsia implicata GSE-PSE-MK54-09C]
MTYTLPTPPQTDASLLELLAFSAKVQETQSVQAEFPPPLVQPQNSWRAIAPQPTRQRSFFLTDYVGQYSGAAPLMPLRDRDVAALSAWFADEDMGAIAADIQSQLQQCFPEPCWEDDPFGFLHEYL